MAWLGGLEFSSTGHKTHLQTIVQSRGDPLEHGKEIALVFGIFKAGYGRGRGADTPGQFSLGKARLAAKFANGARDLEVGHFLGNLILICFQDECNEPRPRGYAAHTVPVLCQAHKT